MNRELIDISPILSAKVAVWPGDVPFQRKVAMDIAKGDNLTLSAMETTFHVGAHADAPNHYHRDGVDIAARELSPYLGPCQVIRVRVPRGERLGMEVLSGVSIQAPRVLFSTGSFPNPDHFNEDFNSLSPELIGALAKSAVVLVGLDTPSVDPFSSKALESHQALYRNSMAVLEGLVLEHVKPGLYELIALPLKIQGADASPVRAVLRKDFTKDSSDRRAE